MHLTKIEEFSFDHGQHFNNVTGEYHSLNPHTLGRPLTHTEMDYNLIYQKQTLNGFRICGSNNDLTLALTDLGSRLEFTQISNLDADWVRFQAAGLFDGQFVWNPVAGALPNTTTTTVAPTTTTTLAPTTTTTTAAPPATVTYNANTNTSFVIPPGNYTTTYNGVQTDSPYTIAGPVFSHTEGYIFAGWALTPSISPIEYQPQDTITLTPGSTTTFYARYTIPVYQTLTATPNTVDEGQNIVINLSGINIPNGRTVGWTITGVDTNDISGSLTGTFTMNSNQAEYIITVTNDQFTEGTETLTFTCAADDNSGTNCGLTADIVINDTSTTVVHNVTYQVQPGQYSGNIGGQHPNTDSIANGSTISLEGPTWTLDTPYANWTFDGYALGDNVTYEPVQYQAGDSYTVNGPVTFYARYSAPATTTTTAAPTTTTLAPTTTTAAPTYTVTINAVANPSNIVGSHPLVQSGLSAGNYTLPGPTWAVTGYTFIGYDTYSGTPMAPPQYQPNDVINLTADVDLYARYELTPTTTTAAPTTTTTTAAPTTTTAAPTTTTLAPTTTTVAPTTTTLAPLTGYYFHGGQNNYPANADLTAGTGGYFYDPGSGFTPTNDFDQAMSYVMDNMGTMGNGVGSEYDIIPFNIPGGGIPALGNSDELIFPQNDTAEKYYIILPDGQVDLTDSSAMHLYNTNFGANTNAIAKRSFTWNGNLYWIYKTGFQPSIDDKILGFNDSPTA